VSKAAGTWIADQFDLRKDVDTDLSPTDPAKGLRGVTIQLRFKPNDLVDAQLIGLTQTAQSFEGGSPRSTSEQVEKRSIPAGATDEGTHIDKPPTRNNPITAVDSANSRSLDDTSTGSQTTTPDPHRPGFHDATSSGTLGSHAKNNVPRVRPEDATLTDVPQLLDAAKNSHQIFETTALATKGVQVGSYYGSVRWGWRTDDAERFTKIELQKVSDGVPSATFLKSAELWNSGKSSRDVANIALPIPDIVVATAPVTLKRSHPVRLPVGTRLEVMHFVGPLLPGTDRMTMSTLRVADGPHTGITGKVNDEDGRKLELERP
jgi:hypothetical protein